MKFSRKKKEQTPSQGLYSTMLYNQLESVKASGSEVPYPYSHVFITELVFASPARQALDAAHIAYTQDYQLADGKPYLVLLISFKDSEQVLEYLKFEERYRVAKLKEKGYQEESVQGLRSLYRSMRNWVELGSETLQVQH